MLVAERTCHINTYIYGEGADYVLEILKNSIPTIEIIPTEEDEEGDEEYSVVSQSDWFRDMSEHITPGVRLKIRRENKGMTQKELSEKSGVAIPNISLMESDKRPIGLRTAKKLAESLECDISEFV